MFSQLIENYELSDISFISKREGNWSTYAVTSQDNIYLGDNDEVELELVILGNLSLINRFNLTMKYPIGYENYIDCKDSNIIHEILKHPCIGESFVSEGGQDPTRDIIESKNDVLLDILIEEELIDVYTKSYLLIVRNIYPRDKFIEIKNKIYDKGSWWAICETLMEMTHDMNQSQLSEYLVGVEEDFPDIKDDKSYTEFVRIYVDP